MSEHIRMERVVDRVGLERYVAIRSAVEWEDPITVEDAEHDGVIDPEVARFVAWLGDRPVGAASGGRVYMSDYPEALWGGIWVEEASRGRGVGRALFATLGDVARARGRSELLSSISEARPEARDFARRRGFRDVGVSKPVALDLRGLERPDPAPPAGVALTTLAAQPELVDGVYEVASEAFPDIPQEDRPLAVPPYDEWRRRDVERPGVPKDGFFVALAGDEVVGYANIGTTAARPSVGYHAMTGVRRAWRGCGVARALKLATIAWAVDRGLEALETQNDELNAPMRAINARLGYRPLPDQVLVRGPIAPP